MSAPAHAAGHGMLVAKPAKQPAGFMNFAAPEASPLSASAPASGCAAPKPPGLAGSGPPGLFGSLQCYKRGKIPRVVLVQQCNTQVCS